MIQTFSNGLRHKQSSMHPLCPILPHNAMLAVVKVRGNAKERRSWAPKNCWRAFLGPTQTDF